MRALFFDIDSIVRVDSKVCIVSKKNPNSPLVRIDQYEYNLIQSGIYKNKGEELNIGGNICHLSAKTFNLIKSKCKKHSVNITELAFSWQEFTNPEVIENLDYHIYKEHLIGCKNFTGHIYLLCSKNTLRNYQKIIEKIKIYLESIGVELYKHYTLSETFYNREEDKIVENKIRILLQHLVGYKTDSGKFTGNQIPQYENISYYDTDSTAIEFSKRINNLFKFLYDNSDESIQKDLKNKMSTDKTLTSNFVTFNLSNPYRSFQTRISLHNLVKSSESFKWRD